MEYESLHPIKRVEAEKSLESGISERIIETLLRIALHDPDWKWIQTTCLSFLENPDKNIQAAAILSLGHMVRIHRNIDLDLVVPILNTLSLDAELKGRVIDTLDDIEVFMQ